MQILQTLTFWALGGLLLLFALGTLIFRNMIHAFLCFMAALLCVAGVYFSLQADYVGGVQVIVYAGSVAILIVLALFLINRNAAEMRQTNKWRHKWLGGVLTALLVGGSLVGAILYTHFGSGWPLAQETAQIAPLPYTEIANGLLNQYVIAFEAVAALLLAALVAAIVTSSKLEPTLDETKTEDKAE